MADQLKILFPEGDDEGAFIVPALDARSQVLSIKDRKKRRSNLPLLEADRCSSLLHLTCVFLVFLMVCCNLSSLKPTRSMCDGRPFASPLFRRLAGRGAFFCGFLFRWILHFVFHLIRGVALHESSSCSKGDSLVDCGRPCDPLCFHCFVAAKLYWCRKLRRQRMLTSHVLLHSCSEMPHPSSRTHVIGSAC